MFKISLEAARVNAGFDQKNAAKELGVSNKTLCNWEKYITFPNSVQVVKICELYQVPYDAVNFLPKCPL